MNAASARDREVIVRLKRFRCLNTAHLEVVLFEGSGVKPHSREVMTRDILRRLEKRGLVMSAVRWIGGSSGGSTRRVYRLTAAGGHVAATLDPRLARRPPAPRGTLFVDHALMSADVYLAFLRSARGGADHQITDWEPDWLAAERLGSKRVVPDGYFTYRTATWELDLCIEVDLGTEWPTRFAQKITGYLDVFRSGSWRNLPGWPLVLTVTPDDARAAALRRVTDELLRTQRDAQRLVEATEFDFTSLQALRGAAGPLGPIRERAGDVGLQSLVPAESDPPPVDEGSPAATPN